MAFESVGDILRRKYGIPNLADQLIADLQSAKIQVLTALEALEEATLTLPAEHPARIAILRFLPALSHWVGVAEKGRAYAVGSMADEDCLHCHIRLEFEYPIFDDNPIWDDEYDDRWQKRDEGRR